VSLILHGVSFSYLPGTPLEQAALREVDLEVRTGEVLGLLGSVGSGKTTLLRLLKGVLEPVRGEVVLEGETLRGPRGLAKLRKATGLVMQEPELHLFAATVEEDLCFGPRNLGLKDEEARRATRRAMEEVGLSYDYLRSRNPLTLSRGEQRKVALAGVLAMRPRYLLLDEVTSGLDGEGRLRLRRLISGAREEGRAVVLVSHDFEELFLLADRVAVLAEGRLLGCGPPSSVLEDAELMEKAGYALPPLLELRVRLAERGVDVAGIPWNPLDMAERIAAVLGGSGGRGR